MSRKEFTWVILYLTCPKQKPTRVKGREYFHRSKDVTRQLYTLPWFCVVRTLRRLYGNQGDPQKKDRLVLTPDLYLPAENEEIPMVSFRLYSLPASFRKVNRDSWTAWKLIWISVGTLHTENGMVFFSWNLLPTNWYFDLQCNFIVKIVKKTRINSEVYEHEKYKRSHFWC